MAMMKTHRFKAWRIVTAGVTLSLISLAPLSGTAYGNSSALTFGGITVISPLDLVLMTLGAKTIPVALLLSAAIPIVGIMLGGRFFCGWICPVGMILTCSHAATARKNAVRGALEKNLEKYAILAAVLAAALFFNFTIPSLYSPPGVVYRIVTYYMLRGVVGADLAILAIMAILDVLALRYGRTWCNTLCPLGTVISSLSVVNLARPHVDHEKCVMCHSCEERCPMRIPLTRATKGAMMACTKCLECVVACPAEAVRIRLFG